MASVAVVKNRRTPPACVGTGQSLDPKFGHDFHGYVGPTDAHATDVKDDEGADQCFE